MKIPSDHVDTYFLIVQGSKSEVKQHSKYATVSKWEAGKWSCPVGIFALTKMVLEVGLKLYLVSAALYFWGGNIAWKMQMY